MIDHLIIKGLNFLRAGIDGTDGPTDVAGAMVNGSPCRQALQKGIKIIVNGLMKNIPDQKG